MLLSLKSPPAQAAIEAKPFRIPSLDGVRACAFMLVFVAHNNLQAHLPSGFGVTIFFFLSGYLITTLLRREAEQTGTIDLKQFYLRRVLRIFPPFYLVMLIGLLCGSLHLLPEVASRKVMLLQALHLSNYAQIANGGGSGDGFYTGSGVLWSLAVEEHFYLLFPLFYLLIQRRMSRPMQALAMATVCLLELTWRLFLYRHFHPSLIRMTLATDTRFDSILFGCILGVWMNPILDCVPGSTRIWATLLLPGSIGLLLIGTVLGREQYRQVWRPTAEGLLLFPVFIAAIRFNDWPIFRWLGHRLVRRLGLLSYSLYLFHDIVLESFNHGWHVPQVVKGVVALAISLPFAEGCYRWIERPALAMRARLQQSSGSLLDEWTAAARDGFDAFAASVRNWARLALG